MPYSFWPHSVTRQPPLSEKFSGENTGVEFSSPPPKDTITRSKNKFLEDVRKASLEEVSSWTGFKNMSSFRKKKCTNVEVWAKAKACSPGKGMAGKGREQEMRLRSNGLVSDQEKYHLPCTFLSISQLISAQTMLLNGGCIQCGFVQRNRTNRVYIIVIHNYTCIYYM